MDQAAIFAQGEADGWWQRNRAHLQAYRLDTDFLASSLLACDVQPTSIIDWGCAGGDRLSTLCQHYQADGIGIDPSSKAIAAASERDPAQRWLVGTVETAPADLPAADLAICCFVLHWLDRSRLLHNLARIDQHLRLGGHLVLADFHVPYAQKRRYHHLETESVYTWKNDYPAMFLATGLYRLLRQDLFAYPDFRPARPEDSDRAFCCILERIDPARDVPEG
jgi:SAM-dependent methyltransferase